MTRGIQTIRRFAPSFTTTQASDRPFRSRRPFDARAQWWGRTIAATTLGHAEEASSMQRVPPDIHAEADGRCETERAAPQPCPPSPEACAVSGHAIEDIAVETTTSSWISLGEWRPVLAAACANTRAFGAGAPRR